MKPIEIVVAASAVLMASTSLSTAATISEVLSHTAVVNWGLSGTTPTYGLNFAGFNALATADSVSGVLTSVQIEVQQSIAGYVQMTNSSSSQTASVNARLSNTAVYQLPTTSNSFITNSNKYTNAALAPLASSGHITVSGSGHQTYATSSPGNLTTYSSPWSAYVGAAGNVSASSTPSVGNASYQDTGGVIVTAVYTYTPASNPSSTPEPMSMAVLGSGLVGMGLLRRRRR
jgi:hypothetical protein